MHLRLPRWAGVYPQQTRLTSAPHAVRFKVTQHIMSAKKFMESVRLISIIAFVVIEAALIVEIIKAVTQ
jgi:hypothetical protein